MNIHTAACQLGCDRAEAPHFVGAHEHVTHAGAVFQVFQMIELVLQGPPAGGFGEVVRFIDDHSVGVMLNEGFFHRLAHVAHTESRRLAIQKRVVHLPKDRHVVVYPLEATCSWTGGTDAHKAHELRNEVVRGSGRVKK